MSPFLIYFDGLPSCTNSSGLGSFEVNGDLYQEINLVFLFCTIEMHVHQFITPTPYSFHAGHLETNPGHMYSSISGHFNATLLYPTAPEQKPF